jgi:hypothetical protein
VFSSSSFNFSGIPLRPLIHFEWLFVKGKIWGAGFSILNGHMQFSHDHLLKRLSFFHHRFLALLRIRWM